MKREKEEEVGRCLRRGLSCVMAFDATQSCQTNTTQSCQTMWRNSAVRVSIQSMSQHLCTQGKPVMPKHVA